jgi:hypothetical protein
MEVKIGRYRCHRTARTGCITIGGNRVQVMLGGSYGGVIRVHQVILQI